MCLHVIASYVTIAARSLVMLHRYGSVAANSHRTRGAVTACTKAQRHNNIAIWQRVDTPIGLEIAQESEIRYCQWVLLKELRSQAHFRSCALSQDVK